MVLEEQIRRDIMTLWGDNVMENKNKMDRYIKAMKLPFRNMLRKAMRRWKERKEQQLKKGLETLEILWQKNHGVNGELMSSIIFEHSK
jgi:biopolymer transport protein ExbB/TolQ